MQPIVAVSEGQTISFDFPTPDQLAPPLIALDEVEAGDAPGRPVLRKLNLTLDTDDRVALLGANGNGKSTLVKLLAGRLRRCPATCASPGNCHRRYFAQHQTEELDLTRRRS